MIDLNGSSQEHENSGVSADSCNHPAVEDPLHETRQVISFPPNLPCETLIFEGLFWARWNPVIATSSRLEENKQTANKPPNSLVKPRTFKIIVLGESGVGKTCLSFRFCAGKFPLMTEATIGLDFREKVKLVFIC